MNTESRNTSVFEYDNYRRFLADTYARLKREQRGFSYRSFSRAAGFRSPNFLKLVIDGSRNLTGESLEKFIRALRIQGAEAAHFRNLVHLNQAQTPEEKRYFADQIIHSKHFRKIQPLRAAQYRCYGRWYVFAVRELVATKEFQEDPEWIARRLQPNITAAEAREALEELQEAGLLIRKNGKLLQSEPLMATADEVPSPAVAQFHREMIAKGAEAISRIESDRRDISSVTLGLSEKSLKEVKSLVQRFRQELMAIAAQEKAPEEVVQVNFQLFPLSGPPRGKGRSK